MSGAQTFNNFKIALVFAQSEKLGINTELCRHFLPFLSVNHYRKKVIFYISIKVSLSPDFADLGYQDTLFPVLYQYVWIFRARNNLHFLSY